MIADICEEMFRNMEEIDVIVNTKEYAIIREKRVNKQYKISKEFDDVTKFLLNNKNLEVYKDRGCKFGSYLEVWFDFESMLYNCPKEFEMYSFKLGKIEVQVDHPTFLFELAMNPHGIDKHYETDSYWTISLNGISKDNYEEYLIKSLFLIGFYNPSIVDEGYPECFEYLGDYLNYYAYATDEEIIEERRNSCENFEEKKFMDLKYYEALAFYNEGMRLHGHEIAFQYFYKVLEHFFLVCRQEEFKAHINKYNENSDISVFINSVTAVYKQGEEIQLKTLLRSIESEISILINQALTDGIISEWSVEKFSDALYLYRNTIVHGKNDERFSVKIPIHLKNDNEKFWNMTVNKIAELLVKKYCF